MPKKVNKTQVESSAEVDNNAVIVKAGDSLAKICKEHYGSARRVVDVMKYNGLENTCIKIDQKIYLPD